MVLENQLFVPTLKRVIDFGFAELIPIFRDSVLRTLQGKGHTKNRRSRAEDLNEVKINRLMFNISDSNLIL